MKITVTPKNAPTENELYLRIAEGLDLQTPPTNLDALYDVLTEPRQRFAIYIKDADFETRYGGRGKILLEVMNDAKANGGSFDLKIRKRIFKSYK